MERLEKLLIFRVGPAVCCVTSNSVETIMRPPERETHGKEGNLPEIFRHGGRIARTVDVRKKFGLSAAGNAADGNIILSQTDKGLFAFWVDQIINVIDADEGKWGMLPPKLPRDVFSATFMLNDEILLFTDFASIEQMQPSVGLTEHLEKLAKERAVKEEVTEKPEPEAAPEAEKQAEVEAESKPAASVTENAGAKPDISKPEPTPTPVRPKPEPFKTPERPKAAVARTPEPRETPKPVVEPPKPAAPAAVSTATASSAREESRATELWTEKPAPTPTPKPTPETAPPPRNERVYEEDEEEESSWLFPAFALLVLVGIIGGGWYFYNSLTGSSVTSYTRMDNQDQESETETALVEENPVDTMPLSDEPSGEAVLPTLEDSVVDESYDTPVAEPLVSETPTVEEESANEQYDATIEKEDNVVTITLNDPNGDALKEPETGAAEETTTDTTTETGSTAETETEAPAEESAEAEPTAEEEKPAEEPASQPKIITHVVVEGDTLWDIAEKYVKDPYKYPELAKYSNIENPDLIYPGDIVRIQTK